jgi:hypothetical protein
VPQQRFAGKRSRDREGVYITKTPRIPASPFDELCVIVVGVGRPGQLTGLEHTRRGHPDAPASACRPDRSV